MMKVGIVGTGAVARKHAQAFRNIGFELVACTNTTAESGHRFASEWSTQFVPTVEELCRHPRVELVDVCTFPESRLKAVELSAQAGKHVQVEKPIATNLETARRMIDVAQRAGIVLGVVSQHRFDTASIFLKEAIAAGRLGRLLQCDAYVKWYRSAQYYARPIKGSWKTEGGGALISQAIHQVDLLRWFAGPVRQVFGQWNLGGVHAIESEDLVNAVIRYGNGAAGVIQASTAIWPGYPERIEVHGTDGTAVITGDRLSVWDVQDDSGSPPPLAEAAQSGAADPMAISLEPFERQFRNFAEAVHSRTQPLVSGEEGYLSLQLVDAIYQSCRGNQPVVLS
jgi:UDP-N-acetyl-2-amino-2-deoxyglucuronate dehydrogenase